MTFVQEELAEVILGIVSERLKIPIARLKGRERSQEVVDARHLAIYILDRETDLSQSAIGRALHRDHGTVANALDRVEGLLGLPNEKALRDHLQALQDAVRTRKAPEDTPGGVEDVVVVTRASWDRLQDIAREIKAPTVHFVEDFEILKTQAARSRAKAINALEKWIETTGRRGS